MTEPIVRVRRGRAKPLWHGHPWLYSQGVEAVEGDPEPGAVVDVRDDRDQRIGRGFYHPSSQIAVRMVCRGDQAIDHAFLRRRLEDAIALRRRIGLPSAQTDGYRLVNAEGDGLPGLIADVYHSSIAVSITALGMWRLAEPIYDLLAELLAPAAIFALGTAGVAQKEGFTVTPGVVRGAAPGEISFREHGLALTIDPLSGQKTGTFLDQRDNHQRVARLARGARVLDCYTYLGGFALHALLAGASRAVAVDSSRRALDRAALHAERAGVADRLELVERDVFRYLEAAEPRSFDLVVLDPPKFAPSRRELEPALKGYRKLNALGMKVAAEGAILATASCSQAVDADTLERTVAAAALDAERTVTVLEVHHQPADHPAPPGFAEGRYLKMLYCRVGG